MKPRHQKLVLAGVGVAAVGLIVGLVLNAFNSNLVFFYSPSQVATKEAPVAPSAWAGWCKRAVSSAKVCK
jgi:cytochrome c-type biogenesis protein CcmE